MNSLAEGALETMLSGMEENAPANWNVALIYLDEPDSPGTTSLTRRRWEEILSGVSIERLPAGAAAAWLLVIRDNATGEIVGARELRRGENRRQAMREALAKMGWTAINAQYIADQKYLPQLQKLIDEDLANGGDGVGNLDEPVNPR